LLMGRHGMLAFRPPQGVKPMKPANKKIAEATRKATAPPAAPEAKIEAEAAKVAKVKKAPATNALQYLRRRS
jgi:hypothetical protein